MKHDSNPSGILLRVMLVSGGLDIVAPKELQDEKLKALGLTDEEGFEYEAMVQILNKVSSKKRVKLLQACVANTLTPTQMMDLRDDYHESMSKIVDYLKEHPESKQEISPEQALDKLVGKDI